MPLCVFSDGASNVCTVCGREFPKFISRPWRRVCVNKIVAVEAASKPKRQLLGDRIESSLISIGITKERWIEFKREHGLPPTCNCQQRQEMLNDADLWMRNAVSQLGENAANAIATVWAPVKWLRNKQHSSGKNPTHNATMNQKSGE